MSQTNICRDSEQPCRELAPQLESRQGAEYPQEDFLIDVFGVFGALNIAGSNRQYLLIITKNKLLEGHHITQLRTLYQIKILHRSRGV
jgi:hypothetical protein